MILVKIDENGDPVTAPMLRENVEYILDTKNLTDELLAANNYAVVSNWEMPRDLNEDEEAEPTDDIIKNEDGTLSRVWNISTLSTAEKVRRWVLPAREYRLLKTDWTQMPDSPLSDEDKAAWATYRTALRNMTDQDIESMTSPEQLVWPEMPFPIDPTATGGKYDKTSELPATPVTTAEPDPNDPVEE
jgi:hypothetical protein